ncbi:MAG: thiamine pyrophosphate-binding protein [Gammaproteobacteria bacterium]|nr:thiamine pyrophosphate-binding protein [Gammaproteobacteria bacterium]
MPRATVAELLAGALAAQGVTRIFGVPGGGSSLDVIEAAAREGIEFALTRSETAAVMMAAATADLSGTLGAALTTKGPGVANAANGMACAALDRSPVMLITDGFTARERRYVTHQVFDQQGMLAPVAKASSRLEKEDAAAEIRALIELAKTPPFGPVHVEIAGPHAGRTAAAAAEGFDPGKPQARIDRDALIQAGELVRNASRPVIVAGLEARGPGVSRQLAILAESLRCPVLATYKAKGVLDDRHELNVGLFTGGNAESECVEKADLIVLCGLDPVELLRIPWRYESPVVDIAEVRHPVHYVEPAAGVYGPIAGALAHLNRGLSRSGWEPAGIARLRQRLAARLEYPPCAGLAPQQVVELAASAALDAGVSPRIAVDAGAHMFSAMAFWPAARPNDVLISNGLATMAYALPAAIASALHEPQRPAVAFTGDGGLLMCLGELSVAAQERARIVVIVFNDQSLSLIDIKQQQRGLPPRGVRWRAPDFAMTMEGLGGRGFRVDNAADYCAAVAEAFGHEGPSLIDARVNPQGYLAQMESLRG